MVPAGARSIWHGVSQCELRLLNAKTAFLTRRSDPVCPRILKQEMHDSRGFRVFVLKHIGTSASHFGPRPVY